MQPIYIHTSEDANNLNVNYDIAELVGQIKKQNGDSPFMISLTDHNTINKSAYLKAQNLGLNEGVRHFQFLQVLISSAPG